MGLARTLNKSHLFFNKKKEMNLLSTPQPRFTMGLNSLILKKKE